MIYRGTVNEFLDRGLWDKYCEATGTNPWAINEGLIGGDKVLEFDDTPKEGSDCS